MPTAGSTRPKRSHLAVAAGFLAYGSDTRFINKANTKIGRVQDEWSNKRKFAAHHFLYEKPYESTIQNFLYGMCNDYLEFSDTKFELPVFRLTEGIVNRLTDRSFKFKSIRRVDDIFFEIDVFSHFTKSPRF